jgi:hypothetical protein
MKQNTELQSYNKDFSNLIFYTVTEELKKIQNTTSSTFDLSKINHQGLTKKLKKYKKLLKHKDQEIHSLSQYGINESVANDHGMVCNSEKSSRAVSCSSNRPQFNPYNVNYKNVMVHTQLG